MGRVRIRRFAVMNIAFQVEACSNADGAREIVSVECDPTSEDASGEFEAEELSPGTWQFQFVVPASLEGSEPLFRKMARYGLGRETLREACAEAMRAAGLDV
jgi:hypothetical protein